MVQRLAVVLDQHVLVIAANAHTHTEEEMEKENQRVNETAAAEQDCTTEEESKHGGDRERARAVVFTHSFSTLLAMCFLSSERFDWLCSIANSDRPHVFGRILIRPGI